MYPLIDNKIVTETGGFQPKQSCRSVRMTPTAVTWCRPPVQPPKRTHSGNLTTKDRLVEISSSASRSVWSASFSSGLPQQGSGGSGDDALSVNRASGTASKIGFRGHGTCRQMGQTATVVETCRRASSLLRPPSPPECPAIPPTVFCNWVLRWT